MKSYTDLEQSKKLAKILPLESADMEFMFLKKDNSMVGMVPFVKDGYEEPDCGYNIVPCWSLAALFGVLPKIHKLKPILDLEECSILYSGTDIYVTASNLIDACIEIIEKLHKQKLCDYDSRQQKIL